MEGSMAKIKVHELAKELEVQSKDIIGFLQGRESKRKPRRALLTKMPYGWCAVRLERE